MSRERLIFAKSLLQALFLWAATIALGVIGVWSFFQTLDLFVRAVGVGLVAWAMAAAFQFGQNLFIFLKNRAEGNWPLFCWGGFLLCASVDAGTNVSQWQHDNPTAAADSGISLMMIPSLVAIVFVEEMMMYSLAAALHETNQAIRATGHPGWDSLEWAANKVKSGQMFGGNRGGGPPPGPSHKGGGGPQHGGNNRRPQERVGKARIIGED